MKKFKLKRNVCREIWNDGRGKVQRDMRRLEVDIEVSLKIRDEVNRLSYRLLLNVHSYIILDLEKNAKT